MNYKQFINLSKASYFFLDKKEIYLEQFALFQAQFAHIILIRQTQTIRKAKETKSGRISRLVSFYWLKNSFCVSALRITDNNFHIAFY